MIASLSPYFGLYLALLATCAALGGVVLGLRLTGAGRRAEIALPFSGGVLFGAAAFGVLPELAAAIGWFLAVALFASGYLLLFLINRYVHPVCPSCSPAHDHHSCTSALHGFEGPLLLAAGLHCFLDGWGVVASQWTGAAGLSLTVPLAVALHKLPEGIALGAILRGALNSSARAFGWALLAESGTLLGGGAALVIAGHLGTQWIGYPLAITGGCFLYFGFHAVHEEWKSRGALPVFLPALTGAAGAAALQQGVRALLR